MTSPQSFFGFCPGDDYKIARWDRLCEYYKLLAKESPCIQVTEIGKTTLGNPFIQVVITSEKNMANLEQIKADSRMAMYEGRHNGNVCICMQSMSLHAKELGGTQMSPLLAYELLSGDHSHILDNVVLVMIPSANPDGQIMITDFYNEYLGTEHEATTYPYLYHHYAGHDNNRDAAFCNLVESKYLSKAMYEEWCPQLFVDHHQMGSYTSRMFIPPYKGPITNGISAMVLREQNFFGSDMGYALEAEGVQGVVSEMFGASGTASFGSVAGVHNIVGLLTESSHAKMASPRLIYKEQLKPFGVHEDPMKPTPFFPNPWKGGLWKLGDIVKQQKVAAMAVLDTMGRNPARVMDAMCHKTAEQKQKAIDSGIAALYVIPAGESTDKIFEALSHHRIAMYQAKESFVADARVYPKGTIAIPTAQSAYAFILNALINTTPGKIPSSSVAGYVTADVISSAEFDQEHFDVYHHTSASYSWKTDKKIAIYKRYYSGNTDEGWLRCVLDQHQCPFRSVLDDDIISGNVNADILILPEDTKQYMDGDESLCKSEYLGNQPQKYRSGLREAGRKGLRTFVEQGGRLIAFGGAVPYAIETFGLDIQDVGAKYPGVQMRLNRVNAHGKDFHAVGWFMPVMHIHETYYAEKYQIEGTFQGNSIIPDGTPAIIRTSYGKGEIVLIGYSPIFRAQTVGAFDSLYQYLK